MNTQPQAVFLINLVQDVNILRPLIVMADRDFGFDVRLMVSSLFEGRDSSGIWQRELKEIAQQSSARIDVFKSEFEALALLDGHGLLFAGSESHLRGHAPCHDVFRVAPASYLRVTLQHGFECVGFRHSEAHKLAHGPTASFAADIVCAWFRAEHVDALSPSQRGKLIVTGPSAVLQQFRDPLPGGGKRPGLICENLHSVRLSAMGDMKAEFVDVFSAFCAAVDDGTQPAVCLRPHPGGQYMLRNKVPLPANVEVENAPMYRLDMRRFSYGISAPSSVLLDMVLAGIPTAVWRDRAGRMDTDNYADLPGVSTVEEWIAFARQAQDDPGSFAEAREAFLARFGLLTDPGEVHRRYAGLFAMALRNAPQLAMARDLGGVVAVVPASALPT
ncbi:hypothetical protein [Novosphingobium sp. P6W]|uniref:hypothetical protein n=1 Tax=Novosphingobium sp. P6W TaxID=1609758 RepID=UPI0005C2E7D2|nr:hypothetical protein [Novosphingobium sp. P6W]AXB80672.1 hypothetical protein TQ38_029360 [Novosphingobium sp. P6W]KIS29497.1 hypothetical protein TQ38_27525 [Novosphingobium sp. P6W]